MGIFSPTKLSIDHPTLGRLDSLKIEDKNVLWMGRIDIFGSSPEIFIRGTRTSVDENEIRMIFEVLGRISLEAECESALRSMYEGKGNVYNTWRDHFECVSLATYNDEVELTFTEEETDSDYILHFQNGALYRTSIEE